MIGVPLSGGKTLNVTFRSLNTRDDVFKSYSHHASGGTSTPIQKLSSNAGLRGIQQTMLPSPPPVNTAQDSRASQRQSRSVNTQAGTRSRVVGNFATLNTDYNNSYYMAMNSNQSHNQGAHGGQVEVGEDGSVLGDSQRREELKKVVQLGVMRGLSSNKQIRKNSRTTRLMMPNPQPHQGQSPMQQHQEKMYMQIKMRSDGVVPFQQGQNTEQVPSVSSQMMLTTSYHHPQHQIGTLQPPQSTVPFYLSGTNAATASSQHHNQMINLGGGSAQESVNNQSQNQSSPQKSHTPNQQQQTTGAGGSTSMKSRHSPAMQQQSKNGSTTAPAAGAINTAQTSKTAVVNGGMRHRNVMNVSQMGSQTSTDKFVGGDGGGTKNTQTNQSINETFEMIGGASIDIQDKEMGDGGIGNQHHTQSLDYPQTNNQQEFITGVPRQEGNGSNQAATIQQHHQHNSKLEEANSSIDQPSFQTEHEATFLWNNAKIIQNSLSGNSPPLAERSPTNNANNRKSHDLAFDSFMGGAQKKSHNMSLDSPRKKSTKPSGGAPAELIQSHHIEGHQLHSPVVAQAQQQQIVPVVEGGSPTIVQVVQGHHNQSTNSNNQHGLHHTYHAGVFEKVMEQISFSPPLQQSSPKPHNQAHAAGITSKNNTGHQQVRLQTQPFSDYSSHHATHQRPSMKNSSTVSPRNNGGSKHSTRESIQERFGKMASTMNQFSRIDNQIGPIQGHSMQLVKCTAGEKKQQYNPHQGDKKTDKHHQQHQTSTTNKQHQNHSVPNAVEFEKETQVQEYETMILDQPSKPTTTENSQSMAPPLTPGSKKISKISVNDLNEQITNEKGLSKTETQVGVVGVENASQDDGRDTKEGPANDSPPLGPTSRNKNYQQDGKSPDTLVKQFSTERRPTHLNLESSQQQQHPDGGVAVGRLGRLNTINLPDMASNTAQAQQQPQSTSNNANRNKDVSQFTDLSPNGATDQEPLSATSPTVQDVQNNIPVIACQITSTSDDKLGGRRISTSIRHSARQQQDDQNSGEAPDIETTTIKQVVASNTAAGQAGTGTNSNTAKVITVPTTENQKDEQNSGANSTQNNPNLLVLQSTAAPGSTATEKQDQSSSQEKGAAVGGKPPELPMDISSYAANTKNSSTGVPSDSAIKYQDRAVAVGDDLLTSVALQQKIGNLALCFPNSQTNNSFKRVLMNSQGQQTGEYEIGTAGGGSHKTRRVMQIKPDLCNISPEDLDQDTLRNMRAVGVNFATRATKDYKPYETHAKRNRKWRNYFQSERRMIRSSHGGHSSPMSQHGNETNGTDDNNSMERIEEQQQALIQHEQSFDYDGTSSNVRNVKVLQRNMDAKTTVYHQTSGMGNEPGKLVGITLSSNPLDQFSYIERNTTNNEEHLNSLPDDVRKLQTPAMVKSAVGSSRNKAKIQVRTTGLVEKSQANGLSNTQQILQQSIGVAARSRHLQTQGCQRSGLKMKYSLPPTGADPQILSGANSVTTTNTKEIIASTFKSADGNQTATGGTTATNNPADKSAMLKLCKYGDAWYRQLLMSAGARHNSFTCTPAYNQQDSSDNDEKKMMSQTAPGEAKFMTGRQRHFQPNQTLQYSSAADSKRGFGSFSLQVRRRTDQQQNFLHTQNTNNNNNNGCWYNGPNEVLTESQKLRGSQRWRHQQRSVDVTESFKMLKARKIAQMQRGAVTVQPRSPVDNGSSQKSATKKGDIMLLDSINGSQISMQIGEEVQPYATAQPDVQQTDLRSQKFQIAPKTAAVQHRMKGFCCNVPSPMQGRLPYQNTLSQRPGLSPKSPAIRHGIFGPSLPANHSTHSKTKKEQHQTSTLKQFSRPLVQEAEKCQMTLHANINNALKKNQKAPKIVIQEDQAVKNRVNRADLRHLHNVNYNAFKGRVQSLHVPKLLSQLNNSGTEVSTPQASDTLSRGAHPPQGMGGPSSLQLQTALNDPERVNAYAVLNFARDEMPGSLNGRKLHTSQLSVTPELRLDIMLQQQQQQQQVKPMK